MYVKRLANILGYAGLIPFIVFSVLSVVDFKSVIDPHLYLTTYAAIILSFMGAIHWGVAMVSEDTLSARQLGISVIPPLLGWIALLLPTVYGYSLLIISFSLLCMLDKHYHMQKAFPAWYYPMRVILTSIVVLCLILAAISIGPNGYTA